MSILIKGIKMPKSCCECIFDAWGACLINLNTKPKNKLTHSCPLVELPGHGDLIDRDAYRRATGMTEECEECSRKHYSSLFICPVSRECYELEKAPVIIPAERSEE